MTVGLVAMKTGALSMKFPIRQIPIAVLMVGALTPAFGAEMKTADFVPQAASSDAFEIQASQIALKKGGSEKVKAFAKDMIAAHEQSTTNLKAAAKEAGIPVNATLPKELQAKLDALNGASGPSFDAAYLSAQVSVHTKAAELFDNFSKDGESGPVRAFAQQTYPVIRTHLVRAQGLSGGR
jgi:predicted outer membrane protein